MTPSTPTNASKRKQTAKVLQRGLDWARDAISSRTHPSSRPSSLHSSALFEANESRWLPDLPGLSISPLSSLEYSPDFSASLTGSNYSQENSTSDVTASDRVKEASGVAWNGLKTMLRVLEKSADAFPPLKSVVGGLLACLDVVEAAAENRDDYEELSAELTAMASTLDRVSHLASEDRDGSLACILRSIKAEATHIEQKQAHGKGRRIFESPQDREDVLKRFRRIELLFRRLQSGISVRTWDTTRKLHETSLLQGMSSVDAAEYDSSYSTTIKRRACTEKTREKIRHDIEDWVMDPNGAKVYWMNGMAGTGKTTILYSICKWLEEHQQLGGNFFCSRILDLCRNANNILPTLAYQLARYSSAFRTALCKVLDHEPDVGKRDLNRQFKKLILEPMKEVKEVIPDGVVVVIDALDECNDNSVVSMFLGIILEHARNLPIKFIVTSRPEPAIRDRMLAPGFFPSVLHLHDIEESIVEADIKKYLTEELYAMSPPPSSNQLEQLTKRSGKLFIYAATAVRYIHPGDSRVDSRRRLEIVLKTASFSQSSKQHKELDILYTSILSAAFNDDLEDWETKDIRLVLQSVICAKEPLPVQTLASLLGLEETRVQFSLEPLRSVLHVQGGGLVSALHASFPDYIFDRDRSSDRFYCDRTQQSEILANGCLDVMKSQLKFNICHLESSFVFDKDVDDLDERVKTYISPGLLYACRYWGEHLHEGKLPDVLHEKLVDFLAYRLLFWMEVLNLEGQMAVGGEMLWRIWNWLEGSRMDTRERVADAEAFVTRYTSGACTLSTPHVYISALPFCPRSSSVYDNYWGRTRGLIHLNGSAAEKWSKAAIATWITDSAINSVAYSPDGTRVVSGSHDKTVRVWDARTGDPVAGPFKGHTHDILSVAFSPDGTRVASGSFDNTIQVWDASTGDIVAGPFKGHTGPVHSVAFSPDGLRVVSGSDDYTIRVWNAHTGDAIAGPFKGHKRAVKSVSFSPDGTRIVSGSYDNTIRVWDSNTGDVVVGSFVGHTYGVLSVAFSPDGARIASGSDDNTIRVWDSNTGNVVAGPFIGHKLGVLSVAFSPDGTYIVSGSTDGSVRLWDASTGNLVTRPFEGHASLVYSVAISPDGSRIISGSHDQTIRLWDARTGDTAAELLAGHTSPVHSVAFSPDGTRIVSGSSDSTIQVWDAHTGDAVTGRFEGHGGTVSSVGFSSDGTHIASSAYDATIRVWDAYTGDLIAGPFQGHTNLVYSVAFSPDGSRIVSGSYDETIRVWNAYTGDVTAGPFEGNMGAVYSVAFSPEGTRIVSGSDDKTVRVWDVRTGNTVAGPFEGHTGPVHSVAFSPDGTHIVSGSSDKNIRVWDAHTGDTVAAPFEGHTGRVNSVAFSSDGTRIVSGSSDKTVRVWNACTGNLVAEPFKGHTHEVHSVAFSPDDTCVVSGSDDCAVRIWDLHTGNTGFRFADIPPNAAVLPHNPHDISSCVEDFAFNIDGWLTTNNVPFFWVSPHFHLQMPQPRNTLVVGPQGSTSVDYHNLNIGDTWTQCFH